MSEARQENWITYGRAEDGLPLLVSVDLSLTDATPDAGRPHLVSVSFAFDNVQENGFPEPEALEIANAYDDRLVEAFKGLRGVQVGRAIHDGRVTNYYYVADADGVDAAVDGVFEETEGFTLEVESQEDTEWECYSEFLLPTAEEYREALDMQLVSVLMEQGDKLDEPRPVTHYLYFDTDEDRERFVERVEAEGFNAEILEEDEDEEGDDEEEGLGVAVTREDAVELETISGVTTMLAGIAEECNGFYDGWETELRTGE